MMGDIHTIATKLSIGTIGGYLIGIKNNKIIVGILNNETASDANYNIELVLREFNSIFPEYPRYFVYSRKEFIQYIN